MDGALPGEAEGDELGVSSGDVEVAGHVVCGEGVGGAAHVPVHGACVAPDAELDCLVAAHLGEGLRFAHVGFRDVVAAAVDGGPHCGGPERCRSSVEVAAYPLSGAAGVLEGQGLVGECGGLLFDVDLSASTVVACDDLGEAIL